MNSKLISIIVPIYNAEKYIKRCIESILNQTYTNLEIILVNDGSQDKSLEICNSFAIKDTRIKVIDKKNEGVSKARNEGIDVASGEYIIFVDSDDWMENTMCEEMIQSAIINNSDIVVCGYNNYLENDDKYENINLKDYNDLSFAEIITDDDTLYGGFPWNKMIKTSILKYKFNDKVHYYENLLFFVQNGSGNIKYSVVHKRLYNYCINDNSAVHSKKYSLKKLSALEALKIIIPLLPQRSVVKHKYIFLTSYYNNLYYIKSEKLNIELIVKYKDLVVKFYNEIKKSKELTKNNKLKLFILYRFNILYFMFKKLKDR